MNLMSVWESANQIALAINKVMGVDVVIIDSNLTRITDTFSYASKRILIRKNSIVGRIIATEKPLAIDNKQVFRSCIDCPDYGSCRMESLIGVPIFFEGKTVGALALAIPPNQRVDLFSNLSHTVGFLEQMAEMLTGKLQATRDYQHLILAKQQRELLINTIKDAVVLVDSEGRIAYHNEPFDSFFLGGRNAIGKALIDLIHHPQIDVFFQKRESVKNLLIYCETRYNSFDGYLSITPFTEEQTYHGAVFIFRELISMDDVYVAQGKSHYTLDSLFDNGAHAEKLKNHIEQIAQKDDAVFLKGEDSERLYEVACILHNLSKRSRRNFVVLNCRKSSLQELEDELYGEIEYNGNGKLRIAHKGTLCLRDVEYLPQYLQRRIFDYLVRGTVVISNGETVSDARLILTSTVNIEELVQKGMFESRLYELVSKNKIALPAFVGNGDTIETLFLRYIGEFSDKYGVRNISAELELLDFIRDYNWDKGLNQLRMVAEYMVKGAHGSALSLQQIPPWMTENDCAKHQTVVEYMEEQLRSMVEQGDTIEAMCERLQISRATIYRKMKKYNIGRKEESAE